METEQLKIGWESDVARQDQSKDLFLDLQKTHALYQELHNFRLFKVNFYVMKVKPTPTSL